MTHDASTTEPSQPGWRFRLGVSSFALGSGFTAAGSWNTILAVLFLVLANSQAIRLHVTSTGVAWALSLSLLIARAFEFV